MAALLILALLAPPSTQSVVYYNARMALREGQPLEVIKLWLLRNAIESQTQKVSGHDADFRSVTWAALGALGLCPDGLPQDDDGAGLWPLALHNWVVRNRRPAPPAPATSPFAAFRVGRQQRHVSLRDVLDADELKAISLRRTGCWWQNRILLKVDEAFGSLEDPQTAARSLRWLLTEALRTLRRDRVVGTAAIEARIFDLDLRLTGLAARARQARRDAVVAGRRQGLSPDEVAALAHDSQPAIDPKSEAGRTLTRSLGWSAEEWMTLSPDRRQYLFGHLARLSHASAQVRETALRVLDELIEARRGTEAQSFIAHASTEGERAAIWSGDRGARLLALDEESGFRERSVIALHRGVDALGAGRLPDALRDFALALQWADTSRAAESVRDLARRWLSFTASRFRMTDELLAMLQSVVPRTDYAAVLEDQLWVAALSADAESFERCVRHQPGHGALAQRSELLRPLSRGEGDAFAAGVAGELRDEPYLAVRLLEQFVARLEAQDAEVRARQVPLLRRLKVALAAHLAATEAQGGQRRAEALLDRMRALIDGLVPLPEAASAADRAHALAPDRAFFAGSVRVAPSDPLPWPFVVAVVDSPSVFTPLALRPEEWRGPRRPLQFGWRVLEP